MALCACSNLGSGDPPNPQAGTVVGSIHGQPYAIADATSGVVTMIGNSTGALILMSNYDDLCARIGTNVLEHDEQLVSIFLTDFTAGSDGTSSEAAPTGPGSYVLPGDGSDAVPNLAAFTAHADDGSCTQINSSVATGSAGTVTLTAAGNSVFTGSFDVTLDSGDHVTGTFSPSACLDIQVALGSTTPSCE